MAASSPPPLHLRHQHPDALDASLRDFEPPPDSPQLPHNAARARSSEPPTEPGAANPDTTSMTICQPQHHQHQPHRRLDGGRAVATMRDSNHHHFEDSDAVSAGGYSPPAWRRLDNGARSSGFWRNDRNTGDPLLDPSDQAMPSSPPLRHLDDDDGDLDLDASITASDFSDEDRNLEGAFRTLFGTLSPSPEKDVLTRFDDPTIRQNQLQPRSKSRSAAVAAVDPPARRTSDRDNYIRIQLNAEVGHDNEILESLRFWTRYYWAFTTRSRLHASISIMAGLLLAVITNMLIAEPAPLPMGDVVKVAGVARSFEPLIYYSEHAVAQVQDLQATSIAVWDLGESVRYSSLREADSIVSDLEVIGENMKHLAIEMTSFFARVDGDIDHIINIMDWAKMHLNRVNKPPSTLPFVQPLSHAYDNIHNLLSYTGVLADATGSPTRLGNLAVAIFGQSNPQRLQKHTQLVFNEFLEVLESSIEEELQHSLALFARFQSIDKHFHNLAHTVVGEYSVQDELRADELSGLWTRVLGTGGSRLRKYDKNRLLLNNVREKTVRNKGALVDHNGKLLTLKASLEGLRQRIASPLIQSINSSTALALEDQIQGLADVSAHLAGVRRQQRSKVMESLFATIPAERYRPAEYQRAEIDGY